MNCDVRIAETGKTVEIRDARGILKYSVSLEPGTRVVEDGDGLAEVRVYKVLARSYCDGNEGAICYQSDEYRVLAEAECDFKRNVSNYRVLVKATGRPLDDITVFQEKIEYRKIDPDCCYNCVFCNRVFDRCTGGGHKEYSRCHLVCENPENFTVFEGMSCPRPYSDFMNPNFDDGFHPSFHDPMEDQWQSYGPQDHGQIVDGPGCGNPHPRPPRPRPCGPGFMSLDVRPKVDHDGICKRYVRGEPRKEWIDPCAEKRRIYASDVIGLDKAVDERIDLVDQELDGQLVVGNLGA